MMRATNFGEDEPGKEGSSAGVDKTPHDQPGPPDITNDTTPARGPKEAGISFPILRAAKLRRESER
jgi:hypothetical protein